VGAIQGKLATVRSFHARQALARCHFHLVLAIVDRAPSFGEMIRPLLLG